MRRIDQKQLSIFYIYGHYFFCHNVQFVSGKHLKQ